WRFCPPPGWPTPPDDWEPAADWRPDDGRPDPPPHWIWWVREERDEPGRRSLAWPLVALGLACAFLAAAIVYVTQLRGPVVPVVQRTEFASPAAPPGSSEEAREQAIAIDDLLEESGPSRRRLRPAIEKVLSCSDVDTGIETI